MAGSFCSCGRIAYDDRQICSTCYVRQTKRHSRSSRAQHQEQRRAYTPSPEAAMRNSTRSSPVRAALNSAFASEEDVSTFFPPSLYDRSITSSPRPPASPAYSQRSSSSQQNSDLSDDLRKLSISGSSTPTGINFAQLSPNHGDLANEFRRLNVSDTSSPMAAGFARLSRNNSEVGALERSYSSEASLQAQRMFSGAP